MSEEYLFPLITNPVSRKTEELKRKKKFFFESIDKTLVEKYLEKGWSLDKELKTKTRMKKLKLEDESFENRLWNIFNKMGFPELNKGREFKVKIHKKNQEPYYQNINIFAKDDETVIISICNSKEQIEKISLTKEINEFSELQGSIGNSVKKHYGSNFKPKILWLYATNNIIWKKSDKELAKQKNIKIITEKELRYLTQIVEHLGPASRYQFLAEYFKNKKIPELTNITVPAIKGKLGKNNYYSFIMTPNHLLKIAFVNHRSLNDPEGVPAYQRLVNKNRLKKISKFIESGGIFPTNILINFKEKVRFNLIKKDELTGVKHGTLYLPNKYQSAWIIDGQHRLFGYSHLKEEFLNQNILVIAFEELSGVEEANLFVTINHEQQSVPKNLLDELEGELKWGSKIPSERIGSMNARLIGLLNQDVGEPFFNRITQQGIPPTPETCLTTPQLKDGLRISGLLGRSIDRNKTYSPGPFSGSNDFKTLDRARRGLNQFFSIIRNSNRKKWEEGRSGNICNNIAIQAYFRLFSELLIYVETKKSTPIKSLEPEEMIFEIKELLKPIEIYLSSNEFSQIEVKYGSGGPPHYFFQLCEKINLAFNDFIPEGYLKWKNEQSEENINNAEKKLKELNKYVTSCISNKFKEIYGDDHYLDKGITNKEIMADIFKRSLEDEVEKRLPLENYLTFIEMKKIIGKEHWDHFKDIFNIPEKGEKGKAKNLKWMDKVNKLRRIPAHQTEAKNFTIEDFEYIDWIYEEFMLRFRKE